MNSAEFDDELPFVREECGDTMWDEETLNQLTAPEVPTPVPAQNDPLTVATDPEPTTTANHKRP